MLYCMELITAILREDLGPRYGLVIGSGTSVEVYHTKHSISYIGCAAVYNNVIFIFGHHNFVVIQLIPPVGSNYVDLSG